MKKRLFASLLCLALCLSLLPTAALATQDPVWYIERGWGEKHRHLERKHHRRLVCGPGRSHHWHG